MISLLEKLGFSEKEAKVYLATLELGEETVQNIAKKAGVNRATTYVVLEKLMQIGVVSTYDKGKKTYFVAEDPKELTNILNVEKQELETREKELKENLNQLTAIYNLRKGKPVVRFFEGPDGLVALDRYGHVRLKKGSELLTISPLDLIDKYFPQRRKESLKERVQRGIRARTIYTHEGGPLPKITNKQELREGVFISREQFPLTGTISIYPGWGVKLYYFDPHKPYGVAIESPEIADNMRLFFELAWTGAIQIKKE